MSIQASYPSTRADRGNTTTPGIPDSSGTSFGSHCNTGVPPRSAIDNTYRASRIVSLKPASARTRITFPEGSSPDQYGAGSGG